MNTLSHVPQSIYISDASIAENIAFGMPIREINFERLTRVCETAELSEFIGSLPQGLNSLVGENGTFLSGGQRQRIGIARALYLDPEVRS